MTTKTRKEIAITAGVFGIMQTVVAFGVIVCAFIFGATNSGEATPYWCGFPLMIPGCLGIAVLITKNACVLVGSMVVNILMIFICCISAGVTALASAIWKVAKANINNYTCATTSSNSCSCFSSFSSLLRITYGVKCDDINTIAILLDVLTALAVIGALLAFAASITGCVGTCCHKENHPNRSGIVVAPAPAHHPLTTMTSTSFSMHTGPPPTAPLPGHAHNPPPAYPTSLQPGYPATTQPGYPPAQSPGYNHAQPPPGYPPTM